MFEPLEQRQMMSANLSGQEPGLLIIFGTTSSDVINVTRQSNGRIRVDDNGTVKTFASSAVREIWAVAGAGHDAISMQSDLAIPATIQGDAGNDTLRSAAGNDYVFGGDGHDRINGRAGNDRLDGDAGNDVIQGSSGNDSVRGLAGRDTLYAGGGADLLEGGDNNDVLVSVGGGTHDSLRGNNGTDTFWADDDNTENITSGSAETVHRINKFRDLRVYHGFLDETVQTVSLEPSGQNLLDPKTDGTYADFSANPLFSSAGPVMTDVNQDGSDAHDCYLMSALAGLAKIEPNFIARNMVDLGDGTYAVKYQGLFGPEYIRVDGNLPTVDGSELKYARLGAENSLWVAIMEKAFAFLRRNEGTYVSMDYGPATEVLNVFGYGGQRDTFSPSGMTATSLFNRIVSELDAGRAVIASSTPDSRDVVSNMRANHVFLVDRVETGADGVRRLVVRDPRDRILKLTKSEFFQTTDGFTSIHPL
jgi:hypothetical protein